jgi:hypothetical protein
MIRYGARPLPLDKAGSTSVEVGGLDAQLARAAQERSKAFKRRGGATKAA